MKINQLFESNGETLYHGSSRPPADYEGIIKFRFRNLPSDTFIPFHNTVNELSQKKFGVPIRSCFFCTISKNKALAYGEVLIVEPISPCRIFLNPYVFDMTDTYNVHEDTIFHELTSIVPNTMSNHQNNKPTFTQHLQDIFGEDDFYQINLETFKHKIINNIDDEEIIKKTTVYLDNKIQEANEYVTGLIEYNDVDKATSSIHERVELMVYAKEFKYKKA